MPRASERFAIHFSRAALIKGVKSRWVLLVIALLGFGVGAAATLLLFKQSPPVAPQTLSPNATALLTATPQAGTPPGVMPTFMPIATPSPGALTAARVIRVVDGDTLEVEVAGRVSMVKLSGVDAPDIAPQPMCFGRETEEYVGEMIKEPGERVWLEQDVSESDSEDRLPRYVWLDPLGAKRMLNEVLLAEGYAKVAVFPPDTRYEDRFLTIERDARVSKRGLWGVCGGFGVLLPSQTPFVSPTAVIPAPTEALSLTIPTISEPGVATQPASPISRPSHTPISSPVAPIPPASSTVRPMPTIVQPSPQPPTQIAPEPTPISRPTTNLIATPTTVAGLRYDPNGPDRDCPDFTTQAEAQAFFIAAGGPGRDPHRLDGDNDEIACEALP